MNPEPRSVRRVVALAVARDARGEAALVDAGGFASLPAEVVGHGEHPREAAARALDRSGLRGEVGDVVAAVADTVAVDGTVVHTVALAYGVRAGTSWRSPGLPPTTLSARVLGLTGGTDVVHPPYLPAAAAPTEVIGAAGEPEPVAVVAVQRPAAYAVVVDAGRVLLTRLAQWEGIWTLPGGGIDPGEQPADALVREVHEEAGLDFTPGRLLFVDSRRYTGHAPDGRLEDFHGIRIVYSGSVPLDVTPRVVEVGGSTDAAAWVPLDRLATTPLTSLASGALAGLA